MTIGKIKALSSLCDFVNSSISSLTIPLMIIHGPRDDRRSLDQSEQLKMNAGSPNKYIRTYSGAKHGLLHNEDFTMQVLNDSVAFIKRTF